MNDAYRNLAAVLPAEGSPVQRNSVGYRWDVGTAGEAFNWLGLRSSRLSRAEAIPRLVEIG